MAFNKNLVVRALAAAALCSCAALAQVEGDWARGFAEQAAPAAPAGQPQAAPVAQAVPADQAQPGVIDVKSSRLLGTEISAAAMATAPYLILEKRSVKPGEGRLLAPSSPRPYQQFEKVVVKPVGGRALPFNVGDTVDILNSKRRALYSGKPALLVRRTGRAVVVDKTGKRPVIQLLHVWGPINGGESIARAAAFTPVYSDRLAAPETKVQATVIYRVDDDTPVPHVSQQFIIDKGAGAGVRVGDFFKVVERTRPNKPSEEVLDAQVVNVTAGTATLIILKVSKERFNLGDEAFMSYRPATRL